MEMGSSSEAVSGANGSIDSLNGLQFGKKIYFETASNTSNNSSTNTSIAPPQKKGKASAAASSSSSTNSNTNSNTQQMSIPRCQVEGCKVDLTGAKAYYCRHKVCGMHSKSPKVVVAGIEQRFCQQCSRFHQLHEFDQGKRSCRRRLAGHNERRRKPPPGPLSPRYGRLLSTPYEDSTRFRSFLMDFSYPRPSQSPSREMWPRVANIHHCQGSPNTCPNSSVTHTYAHASNQYTSELPLSEYFSGVSDSSCALSLLSTQQQWGCNGSTIPRNRAPNSCNANNTLDGVPMGMTTGGCMVHPYGFKNNGAGSSTANNHEMQHDMGLTQFNDGDDVNGQFSGELELALQGNRHCPDHGSVRCYDHSAHGMHWSL